MDGQRGSEDLAAYYVELLEEQTESGLSVTAFAEQVGVSAATLYSWRRRLQGGGRRARLLEVEVVSEERREPMTLEVGRFRIAVRPDFDDRALQRLVVALQRC